MDFLQCILMKVLNKKHMSSSKHVTADAFPAAVNPIERPPALKTRACIINTGTVPHSQFAVLCRASFAE